MPLYIYNRVFFLLQYNKCICTKQSGKRYWCSNWKILASFHTILKENQDIWRTSLQIRNTDLLTNLTEVSNFIKPVIFEARLSHWISSPSTPSWVCTPSSLPWTAWDNLKLPMEFLKLTKRGLGERNKPHSTEGIICALTKERPKSSITFWNSKQGPLTSYSSKSVVNRLTGMIQHKEARSIQNVILGKSGWRKENLKINLSQVAKEKGTNTTYFEDIFCPNTHT